MTPRYLLKDYFKAKKIDTRDIHVFIVSTGKCLPTFYLSNKKFAVILISLFTRQVKEVWMIRMVEKVLI